MPNESAVPKIAINGNEASSSAPLPGEIPDTCACWESKTIRQAKRLLKKERFITCKDATAFAAITALSYELLIHGEDVKAKPVKGW